MYLCVCVWGGGVYIYMCVCVYNLVQYKRYPVTRKLKLQVTSRKLRFSVEYI